MSLNEETQSRNNIEKDKRVVECPNCSYPLIVEKNITMASCPCCSSTFNINQPKNDENKMVEKVSGIKTISAAKAHIEFLFDNFDWDSFSKIPGVFTIKEVDILLDNIKTAQGDNKDTWITCFNYLSKCILCKLEQMIENIDQIADRYVNGDDKNTCDNNYDTIKESFNLLKAKQDKLLLELNNYKDYARKFGAEDTELNIMDETIASIATKLNSVTISNTLEEQPKVAIVIKKKNDALESKYIKLGIDAKTLYKSAIEDYERKDFKSAIDKFDQIIEYYDSQKYVSLICRITTLGSNIICLNDKIFFAKGPLYREKCGLLNTSAQVTLPFDTYIRLYGDRFYYYDKDQKNIIRYFDITESISQKKKKNQYPSIEFYGDIVNNSIHFNMKDYKTAVFLIKHDPVESLSRKIAFCKTYGLEYNKKINKKINYENWHDIILFDFKTGTPKIIAEGVNMIARYINDVVYYIAPIPVYKKQVIVEYNGTGLYYFDVKANEKKLQVTGNSMIRHINEDKSIIFTRNDHGENNKTIYTKRSLDDEEEKVVVRNVYDFYKVISGKIFYYVGNKNIRSLCSINPDGTGFVEVMKYMLDISFMDEDLLYITRGGTDFVTLYRLSINGGNPEKVAFGVWREDLKNPTISHGYLYYTNFLNTLCRVRLDGSGYQELVFDVYKVVNIECNKIFYICLDETINEKNIFSLYQMNMDGSNREKLIYNLKAIKKLDEKELIYTREETLKNKKVLYERIKNDPKLQKMIDKMYKKFEKKKKVPSYNVNVVYNFNCETTDSNIMVYNADYPNIKDLKIEMKEVIKKK